MRILKSADGGQLHYPDFAVEIRKPLPDSSDATMSYGSKAFYKIRQLNRHFSEAVIEVSERISICLVQFFFIELSKLMNEFSIRCNSKL